MKRLAYLILSLAIISCDVESSGSSTMFQVEVKDGIKGRLNLSETQLSAVNCLCCFAYNGRNGLLETVCFVNGDRFSLSLDKRAPHTVFVLANMGDQRAMAPLSLDEMEDYSCSVPSFEAISSGGIPMCGSVSLIPGASSSRIGLHRLMSRFFVSVRYADNALSSENLTPRRVSVHQCAKVFYPFAFGGSAARNSGEIGSQDVDEALLSGGNEVELFIPENCQGDFDGGILLPMDKSLSNPELGEEKGLLCTYIEVETRKQNVGDGISGELTYRFFPGDGRTQNFDISGGCAYYIGLVLSWNGMFVDGNWKVERGNWVDERSLGLCASKNGTYGKELHLMMPPGANAQKFYLRFSPLSDGRHSANGWELEGISGPLGASVLSQGGNFATVAASVDSGAQIGSQGSIVYTTPEGRHKATLSVDIVEANFLLDKNVVVCSSTDLDSFSLRVVASNVPLHQISVISTDSSLELLSYDSESGIARARWKHSNNGSSRRSASLVFSGLGASAVCTVHQMSPNAYIIDDEGYGGESGQVF